MANITPREQSHVTEQFHAPKRCILNVLAFSKALHVEKLKNGAVVELMLN